MLNTILAMHLKKAKCAGRNSACCYMAHSEVMTIVVLAERMHADEQSELAFSRRLLSGVDKWI